MALTIIIEHCSNKGEMETLRYIQLDYTHFSLQRISIITLGVFNNQTHDRQDSRPKKNSRRPLDPRLNFLSVGLIYHVGDFTETVREHFAVLAEPVNENNLSGGELARVDLTKLLLKGVNFLIMDEPTNHLDIRSREALETALADYDGTLLMVSHDRYFINKIANRIIYLTPEGIIKYDGNYDDFVERRQQENALKEEQQQQQDKKANEYQRRKLQEAERRKLQNRFGKVEKLIEETDLKIEALKKEFENPELAADFEKLGQIQAQIDTLSDQVMEYMEEWESLQNALEQFE